VLPGAAAYQVHRIGRILGGLKADSHVTLSSQIVDLRRLGLLDEPNKICCIREIPIAQYELWISLVTIEIQVFLS
jgi:hypothetical protein